LAVRYELVYDKKKEDNLATLGFVSIVVRRVGRKISQPVDGGGCHPTSTNADLV